MIYKVLHVAIHMHPCRNFTFDGVHVEGAQRLARIARESGVEKFIHISHLNAQPHPPSKYVKGGSKYLKSKVCTHSVIVKFINVKKLIGELCALQNHRSALIYILDFLYCVEIVIICYRITVLMLSDCTK